MHHTFKQLLQQEIIAKFNPYHDALGRFTGPGGATSFTYKPGQGKMYDSAIEREKRRTAGSVPHTVKSVEEKIRNQDYETFAVFDSKGNMIFSKDGDKEQVTLTDAEREKLSGSIGTHNHPTEGIRFSEGDISTFINTNMQELRVITKDGISCSLRRTGNAEDGKKFYRDYLGLVNTHYNELEKFLDEQMIKDNLTGDSEEAATWEYYIKVKRAFSAQWMAENAGKYGYEYTETHI